MQFETELCPECVPGSGSAAEAAVKVEQLEPERMIPKQKKYLGSQLGPFEKKAGEGEREREINCFCIADPQCWVTAVRSGLVGPLYSK